MVCFFYKHDKILQYLLWSEDPGAGCGIAPELVSLESHKNAMSLTMLTIFGSYPVIQSDFAFYSDTHAFLKHSLLFCTQFLVLLSLYLKVFCMSYFTEGCRSNYQTVSLS